jgi:hypothetical protein
MAFRQRQSFVYVYSNSKRALPCQARRSGQTREQFEKDRLLPRRERAKGLFGDAPAQRDEPLDEAAPPRRQAKLGAPPVARIARTLDESARNQAADYALSRRRIGCDEPPELVLRFLADVIKLRQCRELRWGDPVILAKLGKKYGARTLMCAAQQMPDLFFKDVLVGRDFSPNGRISPARHDIPLRLRGGDSSRNSPVADANLALSVPPWFR